MKHLVRLSPKSCGKVSHPYVTSVVFHEKLLDAQWFISEWQRIHGRISIQLTQRKSQVASLYCNTNKQMNINAQTILAIKFMMNYKDISIHFIYFSSKSSRAEVSIMPSKNMYSEPRCLRLSEWVS